MKATIKSTGKVVEVVSRFMPKKKAEPSRGWVCNLSDGTCIDEKELEYAPDTSAIISSILNEFGRKVAGKCYGMSPVSDSCGNVVNKVNTEEYINRIVDAVREHMMKDADRAWQKCLDERQKLADLHSELEAREDALDEAYANFLKENKEREDEIERLKKEASLLTRDCASQIAAADYNKIEAHDNILPFLDTLSEEPDKDLEESAEEYSKRVSDGHNYRDLTCGFIAGAKWQAEKDKETIELAEEHAYFAGAVNEREQMLKEAVEGEVIVPIYEGDDIWSSEIKIPGRYEIGDKVKIIIL